MVDVSKRIGEYIKSRGYNLADVCDLVGLNYQKIYRSVYSNSQRELRATELIKLSKFLDIDPRDFAEESETV